MKMRISFIGTKGINLDNLSFGGFETVISEMAPRLVKKGHKVTIYCRKKLYKINHLPPEKNGVKLVYLNGIESKNLGTLTQSLAAIINSIKMKDEIIFLFNIGLGIFIPLIKLFRIKVISNLDGLEWERGKWSFCARMFFKVGAYLNTKYADILISDAKAMHEVYKKKYNISTQVITYGAEIRDDLDSDTILQYNLKPHGYYLLATRFIPENNPLFIIENFIRSSVDKPLVVLGRNYYKSEYEEEILKLKRFNVIFLGHISNRKNLLEFYRFSYVYIHAHSVGGTNPTLLEALANHSCVLALDSLFSREVLQDETYGLYFSLTSESFIHMINYLDNNPDIVNRFKSCSRQRILDNYNWDNVEKKYLELIKSMQ